MSAGVGDALPGEFHKSSFDPSLLKNPVIIDVVTLGSVDYKMAPLAMLSSVQVSGALSRSSRGDFIFYRSLSFLKDILKRN